VDTFKVSISTDSPLFGPVEREHERRPVRSSTGNSLVLYMPLREFWSRYAGSRRKLEADRLQECIQVIADALIQAVEFAAFPFCQHAIPRKGRSRATVKTRIDVLDQFEEGH
jgi:hypothetical protein